LTFSRGLWPAAFSLAHGFIAAGETVKSGEPGTRTYASKKKGRRFDRRGDPEVRVPAVVVHQPRAGRCFTPVAGSADGVRVAVFWPQVRCVLPPLSTGFGLASVVPPSLTLNCIAS
jgi:hypothetical protein